MEGLIDGLLTFSRASRAEMSRENLDLTTLVDLVFYELRHAQAGRNVDCQVEPGIYGLGRRAPHDDGAAQPARQRVEVHERARERGAIRFHPEARDGRDWYLRDRRRRRIRHDAGRSPVQAIHASASAGRISRAGHGPCDRASHREAPWRRDRSRVGAGNQGTTVRFWLPAPGLRTGACARHARCSPAPMSFCLT